MKKKTSAHFFKYFHCTCRGSCMNTQKTDYTMLINFISNIFGEFMTSVEGELVISEYSKEVKGMKRKKQK